MLDKLKVSTAHRYKASGFSSRKSVKTLSARLVRDFFEK
mgnify:CR=1 FL=1